MIKGSRAASLQSKVYPYVEMKTPDESRIFRSEKKTQNKKKALKRAFVKKQN
jgi:phosphoribosylaminoimidazole-succinocarboxamide synthase